MIDGITGILDEVANNRAVIQTLTLLVIIYGLYLVYVLARIGKYPFRPFIFPVFIVVETFLFYLYVLIISPPPNATTTFFSGLIRLQTAAAFTITMKYLIKRV